jgi:hypothetical protein
MINKSTIDENKKERLINCYEQLDEAYGKLLDKLENYDFDEQEWEIVDGLLVTFNLRLEDLKDEINFS